MEKEWHADLAASTADARCYITSFILGNVVVTTNAFDAQRDWIKSVMSQKGSDLPLQNLICTFNQIGNLTKRSDSEYGASPLTETSGRVPLPAAAPLRSTPSTATRSDGLANANRPLTL